MTFHLPLSPRKWALLQLLQNSCLAGDAATVDAAFGAFNARELVAVPDTRSDSHHGHRCNDCPNWIGNDRFVCTACAKARALLAKLTRRRRTRRIS